MGVLGGLHPDSITEMGVLGGGGRGWARIWGSWGVSVPISAQKWGPEAWGGGRNAYQGWIQDPAVPTPRPWGPAGVRGDVEGEIARWGWGEAAGTPTDTARSRRCCRRHHNSFAASK